MQLFPAIDLRGGKVVRLHRGDYGAETVYGDDPVPVARGYEAAGAPWVHVVDLEAARGGVPQRDLVASVAAAVGVPLQVGGGVRTHDDAEALFAAGVQRVVVGTAAFKVPGFVGELCARHPGRVAVDLGVTPDGRVTVQGWQEALDERFDNAIRRFEGDGATAFVVTAVHQDGTLEGPDLGVLQAALAATDHEVVASGGVGRLDDLRVLRNLGVAGVIVGRALYEGRFTIDEAVAACA
jgi:phosphoribosylformimino-5-aminoimidazole carboxamide ribotide isomerase